MGIWKTACTSESKHTWSVYMRHPIQLGFGQIIQSTNIFNQSLISTTMRQAGAHQSTQLEQNSYILNVRFNVCTF